MDRDDLEELHYITHVGNIPSICEKGLLSHRLAARIGHYDVSLAGVQDRRKNVRVPGGLLLHDYANTYVTARNPMLYKRLAEGGMNELCVVGVTPAILDLDDVVITDRNAAAYSCRFRAPDEGLPVVDTKLVRQKRWDLADPLERERCRNAKFTEVLVPQRIAPEHLVGIRVGNETVRATLVDGDSPLSVTIDRHLFFLS